MSLVEEVKDRLFALGFHWPFFAIPASRVRLVEGTGNVCKTAYVTEDGVIHVHRPYWEQLDYDKQVGLVAHEIAHYVFGHHFRRNGRDGKLWNIATDCAIDTTLTHADPPLDVPDSIARDEYVGWGAERIYEDLAQNAQKIPTCHCVGVQPAEGADGHGNDATGQPIDIEQLAQDIRELAIQAVTMAEDVASKAAGNVAGSVWKQLLNIPPPKIRWGSFLRNGTALALSMHGYDETTWGRRGRRSGAVGPQFPGWTTRNARIACVIDTSASMSDQELQQCIAECKAAVNESGIPMYLVTHDAEIQWQGWVQPGCESSISAAVRGRGGTDAHDAYRAIEGVGGRFDVFVHLTDCELYGGWPPWPSNGRKRIVARFNSSASVPPGARVLDVRV